MANRQYLEYLAGLLLVAAIVLVIVSHQFEKRVQGQREEVRQRYDACECCSPENLDALERRLLGIIDRDGR